MRTAIVTAFCLFLLMGSTGCLRYYKFNNERRKVVGTGYERTDTLYIQHFVLCNSLRDKKKHPFYPIGGEVIPINEDSVVQQLFASLGKLPLRIGLKAERENHCDSSFHRNLLIRDKKVDRSKLRALALQSGERLVLVPIIYVAMPTNTNQSFALRCYFRQFGEKLIFEFGLLHLPRRRIGLFSIGFSHHCLAPRDFRRRAEAANPRKLG